MFNQPGENALADELDVLDQVEFIEKHLNDLGIATFRKGITTSFMQETADLVIDKPDFIFNLVESISNKGELSYFIPALLNMHRIPYSGNPLEAIFGLITKLFCLSRTIKTKTMPSVEIFFRSRRTILPMSPIP